MKEVIRLDEKILELTVEERFEKWSFSTEKESKATLILLMKIVFEDPTMFVGQYTNGGDEVVYTNFLMPYVAGSTTEDVLLWNEELRSTMMDRGEAIYKHTKKGLELIWVRRHD